MLRRQHMHLKIRRDFHLGEPVLLVEPRRIKAPLLHIRTDAKGADDVPNLRAKRHETRVIQMVPVIVREQENVDGRKIVRRVDVAARERLLELSVLIVERRHDAL